MEKGSRSSSFDGTAGRLSGPLMARMNRDMELAAIEELAPAPDASVLALGFGPGVGVAELAQRLPIGVVGGVDPSAAMLQQARRRNLSAVECGQVTLERSTAASIPWPDGTFTGALAVNSIQLWDPLEPSLREVVRVLAPKGRLVAITHVWALEKRFALEQWASATADLLAAAGFDDISHRTAPFRSGKGLVLRAEKAPPLQPESTLTTAPEQ
jgi:ubiquinone/menaquinone biosynthesis C-methylase UbiE